MFLARVDSRRYFVPALVGLIVLAWLALIVWGQSPYGRFLSHDGLGDLDGVLSAEALGTAVFFVLGWTVMTVAMMLPTSLPLFDMFQRMVRQRPDARRLVALLIGGYIVVWSLFGVAAHAGDRVIHLAVERTVWLDEQSWLIGGGVFLLAGLYQFTPLKYMCLDKCRSPFSFITEHWHGSGEHAQAFKLGFHHGLFCVGCCWSLMLLMFAVGVGNVGWMLVLGAVMGVEKNMPWGRRLSAPLGVALLASGIAVIILAATDVCAHGASAC